MSIYTCNEQTDQTFFKHRSVIPGSETVAAYDVFAKNCKTAFSYPGQSAGSKRMLYHLTLGTVSDSCRRSKGCHTVLFWINHARIPKDPSIAGVYEDDVSWNRP